MSRSTTSGAAAARRSSSGVSIVVPVGGNGDGFARCLRSLAHLDPAPAELLVVVDGNDVAVAAMEGAAAVTSILRLPQPQGPAVARNRGARSARGELLFFVDSDVELPPDAVGRVESLFAEQPELAAVIGSYDDDPADPSVLSQYRNLLHHWVHQHGRSEASTFWGACGAVRRTVFEAVGGFDERFKIPSIEDIELGRRLRRRGHRIALVKDLQVKHLKSWTARSVIATDLLRRAVPWTELMLAEGALLDDLNVKTGERWSVVFAYLFVASLVAGILSPPLFLVASAAVLFLLLTNADLYRFLRRRRGVPFVVAAVFWHWAYLLVCGLGFVLGGARHLIRRLRSPPRSSPPP